MVVKLGAGNDLVPVTAVGLFVSMRCIFVGGRVCV